MEQKSSSRLNNMIIDNSYFKWLEDILKDKKIAYIENNLTEEDELRFNLIPELIKKLAEFCFKHNKRVIDLTRYYVKYNGTIYEFFYDYEFVSIRDDDKHVDKNSIIEYEEFRNFCKKNMSDNFKDLNDRVVESLVNSDTERINHELSKIDSPTLTSGVGGSSVVAEYASKILSSKNHIITRNSEPRDFKYMDTSLYQNVLACSYSGNNYGVKISFLNDLKHYLLSSKGNDNDDIVNLTYSCQNREKSFISLAATLIPCSILLNYYSENRKERILDCLDSCKFYFDVNCDVFEIFSGFDTSVASKYLESTMVESGIGVPIVHDKYSYCHGRSTVSTVNNNIAIYFNGHTELDKIILKELSKYYKDVIILDYYPNLFEEYKLLLKCMYLTKYIAEQKEKDLSGVDYNPMVKKLYTFKGNL